MAVTSLTTLLTAESELIESLKRGGVGRPPRRGLCGEGVYDVVSFDLISV